MATLASLKTDLRFRIGEVTAGSFGTVNYEDENSVDELARAINLAGRKVIDDCVTREKALLIGRENLSIESGVYQIALPSDYVSVLLLQHRHQNTFYTLTQHPAASLFDRFDPDTQASSFFRHYDVKGVTATIIDEGVATNGTNSNTRMENSVVDLTTLGIRANVHYVYNIRDNSRMKITDIQAGYVDGDGLVGGKRNLWQLNDAYLIESGEETSQLLWVWPPLSVGNTEEIVAEQTGLTFTLSDEAVLYSIAIKLSAAVTDAVKVQLEDNASAGTPYQASDPESVASIAVSAEGWNIAIFESPIRMDTSTTFKVVVTDGAGASVTPTAIKVNGFTGTEDLHLWYARYAQTLVNGTDAFEIPNFAHEAVMLWAESLCYQKLKGGRNAMSADARAEYMVEIEKIKRLIRMKDKQGLQTIGTATGRTRRTHKNVPINVRLPLK